VTGHAMAYENGAYPRIRGGTGGFSCSVSESEGLSPHTRGNRELWGDTALPDGPIPAYAGEPDLEGKALA